jgi:hypothetical protein
MMSMMTTTMTTTTTVTMTTMMARRATGDDDNGDSNKDDNDGDDNDDDAFVFLRPGRHGRICFLMFGSAMSSSEIERHAWPPAQSLAAPS